MSIQKIFSFHSLTNMPDLKVVTPTVHLDDRGFFFEVFRNSEFLEIPNSFAQVNHSKSIKGVLRGLHYQINPMAQGKLIRVLEGKIFDVAVDIRRESNCFGKHESVYLDSEKREMLYIPKGFAHGFCVLSEVAQIEYFCTEVYSPKDERGIVYNDPALGIKWPIKKPIVSEKDSKYPLLKDIESNF